MRESIEKFVLAAKEAGELPENLNVSDISQYLLQNWEGALIVMKVTKSIRPLVIFREMSFKLLGL